MNAKDFLHTSAQSPAQSGRKKNKNNGGQTHLPSTKSLQGLSSILLDEGCRDPEGVKFTKGKKKRHSMYARKSFQENGKGPNCKRRSKERKKKTPELQDQSFTEYET